MNPYVIRDNLKSHIGERVKVSINGMRNKKDSFIGTLSAIYPQIFTIKSQDFIRSFSYREIINKEVELTFI